MDNKSISVKKNFIYNSAFQVLILLVPFVTTPYVSRVLGADTLENTVMHQQWLHILLCWLH